MKKCGLKDFCKPFLDYAEPGGENKGLGILTFRNLETLKITRYIPIYKTSSKDKGVALNYCPWCGGSFHPRYEKKKPKIKARILGGKK